MYFRNQDIFKSGENGYNTYRIPVLIKAADQSIIAFCEGRRNNASDAGEIDIVMKRSKDNGNTWGEMQIVADGYGDTFGNPCPVLDRDTGIIWMLITWNKAEGKESLVHTGKAVRDAYVIKSEDNGITWSKPENISISIKRKNWGWYATGPCHGIQTKNGRLIFPCDYSIIKKEDEEKKHYSHVVYSDDHGKSFIIGDGNAENLKGCNECCAVELDDGRILLNMRNYDKDVRAVSISSDGGKTWGKKKYDNMLPDPVCQGSIIRLSGKEEYNISRILFSNCASKEKGDRVNMTVRISYDECKTWKYSKTVYSKGSAYSDMVILNDNKICLLYENWDENNQYERITAAVFDVEWLTDGKDNMKGEKYEED